MLISGVKKKGCERRLGIGSNEKRVMRSIMDRGFDESSTRKMGIG